ncbi:hypothetical protein K1719_023069 [Acacia pycnantha]|nr:hypothetical protein K1719_023069 [Acacia pycnantha]
MDVPSNLDARRRISFFSNSLFMDMPAAPKVRNMLSFSNISLQESSHGDSYEKDEKLTPIDQQHQFFGSLNFPVTTDSEAWKEKIKRLHLLLTVKDSAMDVPSNLDARRRISFFSNSLSIWICQLLPKFETCFPFRKLNAS